MDKTYKYLGTEEREGIRLQQMREILKKKYNRKLRMILKYEFNSRNKITAIGELAVPILRYSFGIINWRLEEMRKICKKTRKILKEHKVHHTKADGDRLY